MRIHIFYGSVAIVVGGIIAAAIAEPRSDALACAMCLWSIAAAVCVLTAIGPAHLKKACQVVAKFPLPEWMTPSMAVVSTLVLLSAACGLVFIGAQNKQNDWIEIGLGVVGVGAIFLAITYFALVVISRILVRRGV